MKKKKEKTTKEIIDFVIDYIKKNGGFGSSFVSFPAIKVNEGETKQDSRHDKRL